MRERDARARRLQRLILLRRAVLRRLVLLARRFHLRPALVEFRLRDDALIEQRLDARELALRQLVRRLRVLDLGHGVDVERPTPPSMPSRASICAALASASFSCASVSVGERRISSAPCATARAALDRRRDDAAGRFGGDVGLFLGHQRAGGADEARDRLLGGGDRRDRDGGDRRRGALVGLAVGRAARAGQQRGRQRAGSEAVTAR